MAYRFNRKTGSLAALAGIAVLFGGMLFFNGTCAVPQNGLSTSVGSQSAASKTPATFADTADGQTSAPANPGWQTATDLLGGSYKSGQGLLVSKFTPNLAACAYRIRYVLTNGASVGTYVASYAPAGSTSFYVYPSSAWSAENGAFGLRFPAQELMAAFQLVSLQNSNNSVIPEEDIHVDFDFYNGDSTHYFLWAKLFTPPSSPEPVSFFGVVPNASALSAAVLERKCSNE